MMLGFAMRHHVQLRIVKWSMVDALRLHLEFHRTGGVAFSEMFILLIFMDWKAQSTGVQFMG
jgi:hypothetical protein